jgi:hypothetical protein
MHLRLSLFFSTRDSFSPYTHFIPRIGEKEKEKAYDVHSSLM